MEPVNRPHIVFRDVSYTVAARPVVRGLGLTVARGETLVVLGRSGAGKTTALRLINGLLHPTDGTVLVDGRATAEWDDVRLRRSIGYMIQEVGLFPHLTVRRNVGIVPQLERWPAARIRQRVDELLALVGLPADRYAARYPRELSGGERQRVGVARALAADPPILLCDEPFGAVDPITRADLQREFKTLTARLRKTVVFVTHDVREALLLADRVALLEQGRLHVVDTPDAFRRSSDPTVRRLLEAAA